MVNTLPTNVWGNLINYSVVAVCMQPGKTGFAASSNRITELFGIFGLRLRACDFVSPLCLV